MSFQASYPGECTSCGAEFEAGDEIEYDADGDIVATECCGEGDDALDFDPDEDCPERFLL